MDESFPFDHPRFPSPSGTDDVRDVAASSFLSLRATALFFLFFFFFG